MLGLCLGWMVAGLAYPPGNVSLAASAAAETDGHGHAEAVDHDEGLKAASGLVPRDAQGHAATPAWFGTVVKLIVGLFVAAIVIGVPALRAKGGDPAGLATAHDQAHAHHDEEHAGHGQSTGHAAAGSHGH